MTVRHAIVLGVGLGLVLFGASGGCGGASPEVRAAYGAEVARCLANEHAIADREGTTLAEDEAALAAERARCDAALSVIEHGGP